MRFKLCTVPSTIMDQLLSPFVSTVLHKVLPRVEFTPRKIGWVCTCYPGVLYKCVPANGGKHHMQGGVEILLWSLNGTETRDKRRPDGLHGWYADFNHFTIALFY